ncbi:MAG: hypothetical protein Hals2KO_25930 [Halioglobus sp.]
MFDIGFAELIIIGVVALLVVGPERLPETIRTASLYLNRIRRGFNDIKREVQQELHNDAVMRELKDTGDQIKRETSSLGQEIKDSAQKLSESVSPGAEAQDETHNEAGTAGQRDNTDAVKTVSPDGADIAQHEPQDVPAGTPSDIAKDKPA